jgi:tetratricopeptide (TPR) repeat protein
LIDAEFVASHFALLVGGLVFVCLVIGVVIGSERSERLPWARYGVVLAAASGLLIAGAGVVVVKRYHVDPIRADSHLRVAKHLIKKGRTEESLAILKRVVALNPQEPMYELVRGSAGLTAAVSASDGATRARFFDLSESSLRRAFELAPLDPDHSANLARCLARRASFEKDQRRKAELLQAASEHYDAALRLRPNSVVFLNESGRISLTMGRSGDARRTLERALELDASFTEPYIALGALRERSAAMARARGDAAESRRLLEKAAGIYERALELQPDLETAQRGRDRVRRAIPSTER